MGKVTLNCAQKKKKKKRIIQKGKEVQIRLTNKRLLQLKSIGNKSLAIPQLLLLDSDLFTTSFEPLSLSREQVRHGRELPLLARRTTCGQARGYR